MVGVRVHIRGHALGCLNDAIAYILSQWKDSDGRGLSSLGVLSHLSLRQNGIVDEDCERVVELCALITLNLSHNRFRAVSALSSHLPPRLSRLSLAHNMISTLPNDFSCSKLLDLDVSSNCLVGTVTLPLLPCLRTLKLSGNAITTLRGLDGMPQLDLLDISHNSVPDVQDLCGIRECRMLGKLHGAGNPFADCPRYRYAMLEAIPSLILFDGVTVPQSVSALKAFCREYEDGLLKRFASGCGLPTHDCIAGRKPRSSFAVSVSASVRPFASSSMFSSSLGVVPSPPHARAGVRCAPREEFDVTPLPKPTVILVSAGAHSSLDEEAISDAFLQSLRRKDEEAAERYAAMQAVLSAVAEPLQVSTAPHLSSSACRCEACAMKLGGTESAVVDKPKLARPSTGTAIRPHRKPLTSIDAPDVAPKVVRPKSGAPTHAHRKPAVVIVQDRPSLPLSAPPSARGMRGAKVPWTPILSSGPVLTVTSVRPFASPSHVPAPSSAAPVGLRDNCWTTDAGGARKMPESLQDVASRLSVMGDGPETLSGSPMAGPISRVLLSRRGNKHKASSTRSRSTRTAGR